MNPGVTVHGVTGRMGRLVVPALRRAGIAPVRGHAPDFGDVLRIDEEPVERVGAFPDDLVDGEVVVDFSVPEATGALVRAATEKRTPLVIGTTGQTEDQLQALRRAAERVPVVLGRNFSLGINRLMQALPALRVLLSDGFDVECVEAHHRQKRDAPSGTAQMLLDRLLEGSPSVERVHGRLGGDCARRPGEIGVHSLRLGQLAGEHTLWFAGEHEVITLRHRALARAAFVSGVAPAVRFTTRTPPGLYDMMDVMGHAPEATP